MDFPPLPPIPNARGRARAVKPVPRVRLPGAVSSLAQVQVRQALLAQGEEPIAILAALDPQVRILAGVGLSLSQHTSPETIDKEMSISEYRIRRMLKTAKRLAPHQIRDMVDLMLDADLKMKSTAHAEDVLEFLVGRLLAPPETGTGVGKSSRNERNPLTTVACRQGWETTLPEAPRAPG